jgi:imidazolonepropionase-like amidohydrolase
VGGFAALSLAEDHALVRAAHEAGVRVVYATDVPVVTSARPVARAAGGFSRYLHRLAERLPAAPAAAPPGGPA